MQNELEACGAWYWVLFCLQVGWQKQLIKHNLFLNLLCREVRLIIKCHFYVSVSVSYCTCGVWLWSSKAVQGAQEENKHREPGKCLWGFNWMDSFAPYILCSLWNFRGHCWRSSWFWRWLCFGSSSLRDWSYPTGRNFILFFKLKKKKNFLNDTGSGIHMNPICSGTFFFVFCWNKKIHLR